MAQTMQSVSPPIIQEAAEKKQTDNSETENTINLLFSILENLDTQCSRLEKLEHILNQHPLPQDKRKPETESR